MDYFKKAATEKNRAAIAKHRAIAPINKAAFKSSLFIKLGWGVEPHFYLAEAGISGV